MTPCLGAVHHGGGSGVKQEGIIVVSIMTLKLRAVGTSTALILPNELLAQVGMREGDEVFVEPTSDGLMLSPYDPEVSRQLKLGEEFMEEYRDAFHELAK